MDEPAAVGDRDRLEAAKQHARQRLQAREGVQGFGVGAGTVRVYVRDRRCARDLPPHIDGVPLEPVVVGVIRAR